MKQEKFCNAPFAQLLLSPTGKVHPCCYHFGVELGTCQQSLEEVWNGEKIKKLRQEFLGGDIKTCKSRIKNLNCHKEFSHLSPHIELSTHQNSPPNRLDLRLNGQCNLECVMCDVWQQPNGLHDDGFIWKEGPSKIFPFLKEVDILGGEPFIQQDTFKLIEGIKASNPDCQFSFITNAQFRNTKKVMSTLKGLFIKRIQISMDAITEKTYQEVRKGGDFGLLEKNFKELLKLNTQIIASFCTIRQNWREIPEFYKFCKTHNVHAVLQMAFYDPSQISSLNGLELHEMQEIVHSLTSANHDLEYIEFLGPVLIPLQERIRKICAKSGKNIS